MAKKTKRAASKSSGSSAEYKAVIDDLVMGNRILYDQGVVDGYGHVSARDPRNPERFLLSRARAPGLVQPSDIMEFGLDGEPVRDDGRPVYSERFIHSEIYLARPDVNGVNTVEMAMAKGRTAAYRGRPSSSFGKRVNERIQFLTAPGYLGVAGGIPILYGEECIGGIGVSGIGPKVGWSR